MPRLKWPKPSQDDPTLVGCFINRDWRDDGMASIHLARTAHPGVVVGASFLVDIWAMGLKEMDMSIEMPDDKYRLMLDIVLGDLSLEPVDLELARHLVYGGIEQAEDLGFRLPRRLFFCTSLLGPLPEGMHPDRSLFLCDGRIVLSTSKADLKARLVGTTQREFLKRPDVDAEIIPDGTTLFDKELDEYGAMLDQTEQKLFDDAVAWCYRNQEVPHPAMRKVTSALFTAIAYAQMESEPDLDDVDDDLDAVLDADLPAQIDPEEVTRIWHHLGTLLTRDDGENALDQAVAQFQRFHAAAFPDPESFSLSIHNP